MCEAGEEALEENATEGHVSEVVVFNVGLQVPGVIYALAAFDGA